jgi:type VI secretion system protein ImpA
MTALSMGLELLQPIAADRPCGDDLEDTTLLASFDTFRLFGQSAPHDPVPEWTAIRSKAAEALCRSKDLRLLAHLGCALLRTDGLPAFADTLTIASRWLDTYWRETYPRIDEDAIFRRNALNCFADPIAVVDGVRRAPLVTSPQHGTYSLRDIELAAGLLPGDGKAPPEQARVDAAFAAAPREELARLQDSVARSITALAGIDARMRDDGGVNATPSFAPLASQLAKIDRLLRKHLVPGAAPGDGGEPLAGEDSGPRDAASAPAPGGAIRSRQEAIRALDAVADYFRRQEPSSPIPMLVERAKRLVGKDIFEVLADIAPSAVSQARAAGGLKEDS